MSENRLLKQLSAGDKGALNEIYDRYSARIYRFAFGYLKSEPDCMDIVQEVFMRLWNKRSSVPTDSNLEAFLFTIARNTIISAFRKKISEQKYLEEIRHLVVKNHSDTERQVSYQFLTDEVKELIDRLPEQRKRIYLLSKEKGLPNKAIAEKLQISVKTVEDHMTKARKFLMENLKEYGFLAILFYEMFVF